MKSRKLLAGHKSLSRTFTASHTNKWPSTSCNNCTNKRVNKIVPCPELERRLNLIPEQFVGYQMLNWPAGSERTCFRCVPHGKVTEQDLMTTSWIMYYRLACGPVAPFRFRIVLVVVVFAAPATFYRENRFVWNCRQNHLREEDCCCCCCWARINWLTTVALRMCWSCAGWLVGCWSYFHMTLGWANYFTWLVL